MPPRALPVPDGFAEVLDKDKKKFCCDICTSMSHSKQRVLMDKGNIDRHCSSQTHLAFAADYARDRAHTHHDALVRDYDTAGSAPLNDLNGVMWGAAQSISMPQVPNTFDSIGGEDDDGFFDQEGHDIVFSAGEIDRAHLDKERERLVKALEDMGSSIAYHDIVGGEMDLNQDELDPGMNDVLETIEQAGLDAEDQWQGEDAILSELGVPSLQSSGWFPYASKTEFMLDLMDSMPRLRLSNTQLKLILWVMKECGTKQLPSFKALRAKQEKLRKGLGIETREYTSAMGNLFYMNHLRDLLARHWANPLVRPHIQIYPEEVEGTLSQTWQFARWLLSVPPEFLTPFWRASLGSKHFYVNELVQLNDDELVIPLRYFIRKGQVLTLAYEVSRHPETGKLIMDTSKTVRVNTNEFVATYDDLKQAPIMLEFADEIKWSAMPNPLRTKAKDKPLYTCFVHVWGDDVSGNKSKQYNAHMNIYIAHANLPKEMLQQEYFVQFSSTSPHASSAEQLNAFAEQVRQSDALYEAYDCETQEDILFRVYPHAFPADNPQQASECSHIGLNSNFFCRCCEVGGTNKQKETIEGYLALYKVGTERRPDDALISIKHQLEAALDNATPAAIKKIQSATSIKDVHTDHWITQIRKKYKALKDQKPSISPAVIRESVREWFDLQLGDRWNRLLDLPGTNVHRDTPVEILHTWLLGNKKYTWHYTHSAWKDDAKNPALSPAHVFATRLQASNVLGLTIPAIRAPYMVQYKNNLIGKHFKTLQQTGPFHLHGLCPDLVFQLWIANGLLAAMLWYHEIDDLEAYLTDLQILIDNVLDLWALIDPARILDKSKLHILLHLVANIRQYGMAILYSTEIYESFNTVFRLCSVLSNHLAPSRDIALKFAKMDLFKFLVSGGFWKDGSKWIQAGEDVRHYFLEEKILQGHLGWAQPKPAIPGYLTREQGKAARLMKWSECVAAGTPRPPAAAADVTQLWNLCAHVTAQCSSECKVGCFVYAENIKGERIMGRIAQILDPDSASINISGVVIVELFEISKHLQPRFLMPVLRRPYGEVVYSFVHPEKLLFIFNVQHDCVHAGCGPTRIAYKKQERKTSKVEIKIWDHASDDHYIINLTALHNAALIRKVLPRALWEPKHRFHHRRDELATISLQVSIDRTKKRAVTQAKAAVTRKTNADKQAAAERAAANERDSDAEQEGVNKDEVMGQEGDRELVREEEEEELPPSDEDSDIHAEDSDSDSVPRADRKSRKRARNK